MTLQGGIPFAAAPFPNFSPASIRKPGYATTQAPLVWYDQNAGRPARQTQWSIGIQRQLTKDFAIEASYVGNRGVWWNAPGLVDENAITQSDSRRPRAQHQHDSGSEPSEIAAQFHPRRAARLQHSPWSGFPLTATVAQSLRPFPQFNSITPIFAPLGNTWYDSLQVKGTKRYSHGLSFHHSIHLAEAAIQCSCQQRRHARHRRQASQRRLQPRHEQSALRLRSAAAADHFGSYTTPGCTSNKILSWVSRDWTLNTLLGYSSGLPILAPFCAITI